MAFLFGSARPANHRTSARPRCCRRHGPAGVRPGRATRTRCAAAVDAAEERPEPAIQVPPLYDGWFAESGELGNALRSSIDAARRAGVTKMEIQFPPVPNVDEVAFGTALNQQFAIEISAAMGMTEKNKYAVCRRYLISFANFYWASAIASHLAPRVVWLVSTDSIAKSDAAEGVPNVRSVNLSAVSPSDIGPGDVVIVMDPGPTDMWRRAAKLQARPDCLILMMNPSFVETYDLCGPLPEFEQVFFLKRVSKGWVHRRFGHDWHCFLEKPDQSLELLEAMTVRPKLGYASNVLRGESFKRFGIFNDRWSKVRPAGDRR